MEIAFNAQEIATMLVEYEADDQSRMDVMEISEEIYKYTSGYPFLVSKICKHLDENLDHNWTLEGVQRAIQLLLKEDNTLFDDLFKNLENNQELYDLIYDVLMVGEDISFSIDNPIMKLGTMYGFFKRNQPMVAVSNKVFETRILNYFILKD